MATASKCPACPSNQFELVHETPRNSNFAYSFIRCASCGTVIGVADANNIGAMLAQQNAAIKAIAARAGIDVKLHV
jgi:uncharacterized Zn finger protein